MEFALLLARGDHRLAELDGAEAAFGPMIRQNRIMCTGLDGELADQFNFGRRVRLEFVHGHDHVDTESDQGRSESHFSSGSRSLFQTQRKIFFRIVVRATAGRQRLWDRLHAFFKARMVATSTTQSGVSPL